MSERRPPLRPDFVPDIRVRESFRFAAVGLIVNSALYLVLVFCCAALLGYRDAMACTAAAAGVTYLSYVPQVGAAAAVMQGHAVEPITRGATVLLVALSILLGFAAGLLVLFHLTVR